MLAGQRDESQRSFNFSASNYKLYPEAPARGGARGGGCPPNVEKDGPRNSSEFDEKNWGGGVSSYFQM